MSHIAPSDSEDPDASDEQYYKKPKSAKSHGAKDHSSSYFTSDLNQATINENLSEATGGSTVSKDSLRVKDRFDYKKQAQNLENFDNNNPAATNYGATAATATATDVTIRKHHSESQSAIVCRPRPPMQQQQNQNERAGDQNEGNAAAPLLDDDDEARDDHWKEKCRKICSYVRFASIFIVILIFIAGLVSIVVWLTVINKQNIEPQVTYTNLFEVIQLDDMLHLLTKGGADVKVNLTGRVDPDFEEGKFNLSLYRGSCVSPPNQTLTASGSAENYQILGKNANVSNHVIMLGSSAVLNVSFVLSDSTLMNGARIRVYFFKSYEDLHKCYNSEPDETGKNCPCFFDIPTPDNTPSFSYANGSYGYNVDCENSEEHKPFEGQHYFLTKFLGMNQAPPSIYDHLFVSFTFRYSTAGVFDPLVTNFKGQKCKSLDDTNDKIHEYSCGVDYGSVFFAGHSMCTYLTLATPYTTAEMNSRFRDIFPVTITERHRDDVMLYIAGVVLLAILLILTAYCAPCRLVLKTVRSAYVRRAYEAVN